MKRFHISLGLLFIGLTVVALPRPRVMTGAVPEATLADGNRFQEFQPNIPWNGRFASVDVNPFHANQVIAASDRGGLFSSQDGGSTWHHIDGIPVHVWTVNDPVLATSLVESGVDAIITDDPRIVPARPPTQ